MLPLVQAPYHKDEHTSSGATKVSSNVKKGARRVRFAAGSEGRGEKRARK